MFKIFPVIALIALISLPLSAQAQSQYSAPDKTLSFSYPEKWQITADGSKLRLKAEDGAVYLLQRDGLNSIPAGEAANNTVLRDAAEALVKPLLTNYSYAGVKLLTVPGGSGAIYRFRGKGKTGDNDLAEVWFAIQGGHSLTILPDGAPQPDHDFELSRMMGTLSLGGTAGKTAPGPTAGNDKGANPGQGAGKKAKGKAAGATTLSNKTAVEPMSRSEGTEFESYEGHLMLNDLSFRLHFLRGGTVKAQWERSPGRILNYTGTFTGEEGNYAVKLTQVSGDPLTGPSPISLTMRSLGGMVSGSYAAGSDPVKRDVAQLKLMSVDAGLPMRGTSLTNNNGNNGGNNNNSSRQTQMRRRRR
jgi:hypothetical protein